ncbi:excalibur calcium-binding domain-containing protein [Rhodococcus qingshengii]|uniref:excalibur calcium-binding domain-containing protein n=1 Tax=Rhodococcus qingshengii TaxID=334542 RepID=UPI0035A6F8E8
MKLRRLAFSVAGCAAITLVAAPAAQASTVFDFLPIEIARMIPTGSADAVQPFLPPVFAPPAPQNTPAPARYYQNCTAVRNAGAAPLYRGQNGYAPHLDRDNDGIACE